MLLAGVVELAVEPEGFDDVTAGRAGAKVFDDVVGVVGVRGAGNQEGIDGVVGLAAELERFDGMVGDVGVRAAESPELQAVVG